MKAFILIILCHLALTAKAQQTDFPKYYLGLFYTTGYYTDYVNNPYHEEYRGIDYHSVGINAALRITKNLYVQSNAFSPGNGNFFIDAGIKLNALVYHKLQPHAGLSIGSKLGYSEASNLYYIFGLDWHIAHFIVLQSALLSDFSMNTQGIRIGASYKF